MGGESHAKAQLLFGIVLPTEALEKLWASNNPEKKDSFYHEDRDRDIVDIVYGAMAEGDGLELEIFNSYCQRSGNERKVYVLTCGDERSWKKLVAHADDSKVGITVMPEGGLPEVSYEPEAVQSFFKCLAIKDKPPKQEPKWMMINTCQMLE